MKKQVLFLLSTMTFLLSCTTSLTEKGGQLNDLLSSHFEKDFKYDVQKEGKEPGEPWDMMFYENGTAKVGKGEMRNDMEWSISGDTLKTTLVGGNRPLPQDWLIISVSDTEAKLSSIGDNGKRTLILSK